jgi:protein XagA
LTLWENRRSYSQVVLGSFVTASFAFGGIVLSRAGSYRFWAAAGALALSAAAPTGAFAGAWTLPQGTGQLIATLYGWTGYGSAWGGNPPANQSRFDAQAYVQYGLTDTLTVYGETAFEHYAIGEPTPDTYNGLDYSGLGLRKKLWSTGEWVFSAEATLFIPGAHDQKAPAQEGNTGWAGEARLNAGRNFKLDFIPYLDSVPGFLDAEVAYRQRTQGPPDEWHGDFTIGFKFTPKIMLMLQDFTTVSMSTNNPTFPAWRQSVAEASVVYALNDKWSLQVGVFSTVWTVKTNSERGGVLAVWRNF